MKNEYRVDVHIRLRGELPMDFSEFKSEQYEDLEEYLEAIKQFVEVNISDCEEGSDDNDNEDDADS